MVGHLIQNTPLTYTEEACLFHVMRYLRRSYSGRDDNYFNAGKSQRYFA